MTTSSEQPLRVLVSIATYKRPSQLARLLASLRDQTTPDVSVLVVDNDPDGTAHQVVAEANLACTYRTEPQPGIAAARNRGLAEFDDRFDVIAFIDDDEIVPPGWLESHLTWLSRFAADVVTGPVHTDLPSDAPKWIVEGGFLQRSSIAHGESLRAASTNNTLLRREAWLRFGQPTFDSTYSTTGGSDSRFFRGLYLAGASIRYNAEAVVVEDAPRERLTARWVVRRGVRNGVVAGRLSLLTSSSARVLCGGVLTVAKGFALVAIDLTRHRRFTARSSNRLLHGLGQVMAATNLRVHEYTR